MAGIGFELRRVAGKGGIASFFQIAFSGAMIVAGPWILSIITISAIKTMLNLLFGESLELFTAIIIYSYAFSLVIFGGFHYIFTRRMSDLLYVKKEAEAFGYVLRLCIPVASASALIALPAILSLKLNIPHEALFKFSAWLTFMSLNCLWIMMLFVSALKWYIKILLAYIAGLCITLLLIFFLTGLLGTAGTMLGFASGHLAIVLLLMLICRLTWKPEKPRQHVELDDKSEPAPGLQPTATRSIKFLKKHRYLFAAGLFYYLGIWTDKIIFWITIGTEVPGTFFKLFESYDIPVFYANLSMIPGLVFFVIYSETEFYTYLKRFLLSLTKGRFSDILNAKKRLYTNTWKSFREQCLLQAVVTGAAIVLVSGSILRTTFTAVFFHIMLLTLLNYLFYIEQYRHAFISAVIFFLVNSLTAVAGLIPGIPLIPGLSYALGAAAGMITASVLLKKDLYRLERHILTKNQ